MLGIDIGSFSIKVAVGKTSGRKVQIDKFVVEEFPDDLKGGSADILTTQEIIKRLIKKVAGGEKRAALAVPTSAAVTRVVSFDSGISKNDLEGEVQLSLVNIVPFPLDQVSFDFFNMGKSKKSPGSNDILIVASRNELVNTRASAIDVKQIKEKAVDVESMALARLMEGIKGNDYRETYGMIDIGYRTTRVYVFDSSGVLYSREVQIGGQHLTELLSDALDISLVEAENAKKKEEILLDNKDLIHSYFEGITEQIELALEMFESTNPSVQASEFYLTGGGSLVKGLTNEIASKIKSTSIKDLDLGSNFKIKRGIKAGNQINSSCLALGLVMRK